MKFQIMMFFQNHLPAAYVTTLVMHLGYTLL